MSWIARLTSFFPLIHLVLIGLVLTCFFHQPSLWGLISLPLVVYLLPVAIFRLHQLIWPLKPGKYDLLAAKYVPWWGSYNFQQTFNTFPMFENILLLYPPLFSVWLRLWGAKIGKNVYFTPCLRVLDRPMIRIGDQTLLGFKTSMTSHVILPKNGSQWLVVAPVTIERDCFIGAYTRIGPGATVKQGVLLPFQHVVWMNETVETSP